MKIVNNVIYDEYDNDLKLGILCLHTCLHLITNYLIEVGKSKVDAKEVVLEILKIMKATEERKQEND